MRGLRNAANDLDQGFLARQVDVPFEADRRFRTELFLHALQCLADADGGACEHQIKFHPALLELAPHSTGGLQAAVVEWAVEVGSLRLVPARLGVAKDRERLHFTGSSAAGGRKASLCSTRAIASSSGSRLIGTPGGNALSS